MNRNWKAIPVAVALVTLAPMAAGQATDTGSMNYVIALGAYIVHGDPSVPNDNAFSFGNYCRTLFYPYLNGCVGGAFVWTSEAEAIAAAGGDPVTDAQKYRVMELTMIDAVSGPNVYALLCNHNPLGGTECHPAANDGFADVLAEGCGLALQVDSTDVHPGNYYGAAFNAILSADPATNEVCVGTSGTMAVVFTNP